MLHFSVEGGPGVVCVCVRVCARVCTCEAREDIIKDRMDVLLQLLISLQPGNVPYPSSCVLPVLRMAFILPAKAEHTLSWLIPETVSLSRVPASSKQAWLGWLCTITQRNGLVELTGKLVVQWQRSIYPYGERKKRVSERRTDRWSWKSGWVTR